MKMLDIKIQSTGKIYNEIWDFPVGETFATLKIWPSVFIDTGDVELLPLRFKGVGYRRIKRNILERKFLLAWMQKNLRRTSTTLFEQLVSYYENKPDGIKNITDDHWKIAASIIQWLGTPVGEGFLKEVFSQVGMEIVEKAERPDDRRKYQEFLEKDKQSYVEVIE